MSISQLTATRGIATPCAMARINKIRFSASIAMAALAASCVTDEPADGDEADIATEDDGGMYDEDSSEITISKLVGWRKA